jgi:hypothetical protein
VQVKHTGLLVASMACALVLAGCAKNIDNKEAVQEGVRKGVVKRGIDPNQMDVDVTSVQFHGSTADATVSFRAKGQPAGGGLTVNYTLDRVKDEWVVKSRAPMSTMGHTQGSELPGTGGSAGAIGDLAISPDGHATPNTGGTAPLPPGHPGVGSSYQPAPGTIKQ